MKLPLGWSLSLLFLFWSVQSQAGQYVEIRVDLETTMWLHGKLSLPAQGTNFPDRFSNSIGVIRRPVTNFVSAGTNFLRAAYIPESYRDCKVRCVVGTDFWSFEIIGDFSGYPHTTYWPIGSNVVQKIILSRPAMTLGLGDGRTTIFRSWDNWAESAARDRKIDNLPWLAFCSGPFLKSVGRQIPLPMGISIPWQPPPVTSQNVSVFADALGLPSRVEAYTTDKQLSWQYEVQQSTNFLGWNFPLQFKVIQYRLDEEDHLVPHGLVRGKVTSIASTTEPKIPQDVFENVRWR